MAKDKLHVSLLMAAKGVAWKTQVKWLTNNLRCHFNNMAAKSMAWKITKNEKKINLRCCYPWLFLAYHEKQPLTSGLLLTLIKNDVNNTTETVMTVPYNL